MITTLNVGGRYFAMILLVTGPFVALNVGHPTRTTSAPSFRTGSKLTAFWLIAPNLMGDNGRPPSPDEARGPHRLRQLRLFRLALVYTILFPEESRAVLPDCRRRDYRRMWPDGHRRTGHEVVVPEEE